MQKFTIPTLGTGYLQYWGTDLILNLVEERHWPPDTPCHSLAGNHHAVSQLSQNLLCRFLSNFRCGFPCAIPPDIFWISEKKMHFQMFQDYFRFRGNHGNVGPYGRQNFQSATPTSNHFWIFSKFFWIFQWSSQKYCFGVLKFWVYGF